MPGWLCALAVALLGSGTARAAACPPGRYLLAAGEDPLVAVEAVTPDAVVVGDDGTVAIASGCPPAVARLKTTRKGTRVKARWAKDACQPLAGRPRLAGRFDAACERLDGRFRAKKVKRAVVARRSACGDGVIDLAGGETCDLPPVPEQATPEVDGARATTVTIGAAGGTVEAAAADGTIYRLDVPAGALVVDEAITLTPVVAIPDLPLRRGLVAAVEFGPDGLQLHRPATLTVTLPDAPDTTDLVGFGYAGAGERLHLDFVEAAGATLTLRLTHFSALGAALAAPEDLAALAAQTALSEPTEGFWISKLVLLFEQGAPAAEYAALFRDWYDAVVSVFVVDFPPDDDEELRRALREFYEWSWRLDAIELLVGIEFDAADQASLDALLAEGRAGVAAGLREGVERANVRCLSLQNVAGAEDALRWQATAAALGVGTAAEQLDLDTVLDGLCVEVVFVDTAYPYPATAPLVVGQPATLRVQAGWRFATGGPIVFGQTDPDVGVLVSVTATHATPPFSGLFQEQDLFEDAFAPTGGGETVLTVSACVAPPTGATGVWRTASTLCQTALVVRGLVVEPAAATLVPGGTQQFTAALFGAPAAGVVWSADGGTVDANGLYTAPAAPGAYTVTASVPGGGFVATASVTVAPLEITLRLANGDGLVPGVDARLLAVVRRDGLKVAGAQFTVENVAGGTVSLDSWVTNAQGQFTDATARIAAWSPVLVVTASVTLPGDPTPITVRAAGINRADVTYQGLLQRQPLCAGSPSSDERYFSFSRREPELYGLGAFYGGMHAALHSARVEYMLGTIDAGSLSGGWRPSGNPGSFPLSGTLVDGHLELEATITSPSCPEGAIVTFSGDHVPTDLVVTPSAVTLAAGGTQEFTAVAPFGQSLFEASWEATGGSFDPHPLDPAITVYTAPQEPGTYLLIARRTAVVGGIDVRVFVGTAMVTVP
jgi:hypothetical protein